MVEDLISLCTLYVETSISRDPRIGRMGQRSVKSEPSGLLLLGLRGSLKVRAMSPPWPRAWLNQASDYYIIMMIKLHIWRRGKIDKFSSRKLSSWQSYREENIVQHVQSIVSVSNVVMGILYAWQTRRNLIFQTVCTHSHMHGCIYTNILCVRCGNANKNRWLFTQRNMGSPGFTKSRPLKQLSTDRPLRIYTL